MFSRRHEENVPHDFGRGLQGLADDPVNLLSDQAGGEIFTAVIDRRLPFLLKEDQARRGQLADDGGAGVDAEAELVDFRAGQRVKRIDA